MNDASRSDVPSLPPPCLCRQHRAAYGFTHFVDETFRSLYAEDVAASLPALIHQRLRQTQAEWDTEQREKEEAARENELAQERALRATPLGNELADRLASADGESFLRTVTDGYEGMHYSVNCSDSVQYESLDEALAAVAKVRPALRGWVEGYVRLMFEVCGRWPLAPKDPSVVEPVTSSVPALVSGGELDPVTSDAYAVQAHATLSRGQLVKVRAGAHGFLDACGIATKTGFLEALAPVDASCATARSIGFTYPETQGLVADRIAAPRIRLPLDRPLHSTRFR